MKRATRGACAAAVLAALAACMRPDHSTPTAIATPGLHPAASLTPIATVQELMTGLIDPAADAIWGSVGSVTRKDGVQEHKPQTEAQWLALRTQAVTLSEAANLLQIKGRRVTAAPLPSEGPGVYSSAQIQQNLDADHKTFDGFAVGLQRASREVLDAVDARDAAALLSAGETLDAACEACHASQWYPHQIIPPLPANPPADPDSPSTHRQAQLAH